MAKINGNKNSENKISLGSDNDLLSGFIEDNKEVQFGSDVVNVPAKKTIEPPTSNVNEQPVLTLPVEKTKDKPIETPQITSFEEFPIIGNPDYINNLKKIKLNKDKDSDGHTSARISIKTHDEIDRILYVLRHNYKFKGDIKLIMEAGVIEVKKKLGIK